MWKSSSLESLGGARSVLAYQWQAEVLWAISRLPSLFWSLIDQQYQCLFDIWNSTNQPTNQRTNEPATQPFNQPTSNMSHAWTSVTVAVAISQHLVSPKPWSHRSQLSHIQRRCLHAPISSGHFFSHSENSWSFLVHEYHRMDFTIVCHFTLEMMKTTGTMSKLKTAPTSLIPNTGPRSPAADPA